MQSPMRKLAKRPSASRWSAGYDFATSSGMNGANIPSRFHTMKCEASDELTTSTAWMRLEYSWPMRWNTRSAPVRSTRTATPPYLASNALAIFSASGRSTEV